MISILSLLHRLLLGLLIFIPVVFGNPALGLATLAVVMAIFNFQIDFVLKEIYAMFTGMDLVFLSTFIYRYPIMVCNLEMKLLEVISKGAAISFGWLAYTISFITLLVLLLIGTIYLRIGVILLFPGVASMLMIQIYRQTLNSAEQI